jgi:two-component system response regulator DesR
MGALVIRILLAEDMHMVRGALVALLRLESDFEVVAEVERGDQILPACLTHKPDVAIIDIDLPVLDGLSAAALIHEQLPECHTLILTSLGHPGTLRRALSTRVSGFLLKDAPPALLADAVRKVNVGERVLESPLTDREEEVLRMAAQGASAVEIAASLFLSLGTVRNYLTAIVSKLNARNRVDAIRIARESGLLPP